MVNILGLLERIAVFVVYSVEGTVEEPMNASAALPVFDAYRVEKERISARRLLAFSSKERSNIREIRFEPPTLGSRGFGMFVVTYKRPYYGTR